jgi:preprotein translocase subunit SecG
LTVFVAAIFMVTSLSLAILAKQRNVSSTIIDLDHKSETTPAPAAPPAQPSGESHSSSGESPSTGH